MSVVIEIEEPITEKIKRITGETSDNVAVKVALERFVRDYEISERPGVLTARGSSDLPDEFWEELFAQPQLADGVLDRIIREEREDRF